MEPHGKGYSRFKEPIPASNQQAKSQGHDKQFPHVERYIKIRVTGKLIPCETTRTGVAGKDGFAQNGHFGKLGPLENSKWSKKGPTNVTIYY